MNKSLVSLSILASLLSVGEPAAQGRSPLFTFAGSGAGDGFGTALAFIDYGVPILAVGVPGAGTGGAVHLFSLKDGRCLRRLYASQVDERFGTTLAFGADVDGDDVPDLLIGAPLRASGTGAVDAVSVVTGARLFTVGGRTTGGQLGRSLTTIDDIDGDGWDDFATGAPFDPFQGPSTGMVRLVSGRTGTWIRDIEAPEPGMEFGFAIAGCDDRDSDGLPDLAVGAPRTHNTFSPHWDMGASLVMSTATGTQISRYDDFDGPERFGEALAVMADQTDPTRLRIATSARTESWDDDWCLLGSTWLHPRQKLAGDRPQMIGDVDGDGWADLFLGQPRASFAGLNAGGFRIVSGRTLELLDAGFDAPPGASLGAVAAALGDVDGDGRPDFAVGAPDDDLLAVGGGSVRVYRAILDAPTRARSVSLAASTEILPAGLGDIDGDEHDDLAWLDRSTSIVHAESSQTAITVWTTTVIGARTMTVVGDVDGDGTTDLGIAIPASPSAAASGVVLSGRDGATILTLTPPSGSDVDAVEPAGDVDHDGYDDVVTSGSINGPLPAHASLFSGNTGGLIREIPLTRGWTNTASGAGDVNGDGTPDLMISVPTGVEARSGIDGSTLWSVPRGDAFLRVGDLDGDGLDDPILLEVWADRVTAISGATQQVIWEVNGFYPWFGGAATALPDQDGDGVPDLAIGSSWLFEPWFLPVNLFPAVPMQQSCVVVSGRTGQPIWTVDGPDSLFGYAVRLLGDTNGNGRLEIGVGGVQPTAVPTTYRVDAIDLPRRQGFRAFEDSVSLTSGGTQEWRLHAGPDHAGDTYVIFGGRTGLAPGFSAPGLNLPLNLDDYTLLTLASANQGAFLANLGILDPNGDARAAIVLPAGLPLSLADLHLHHAAVTLGPSGFAVVGDPCGLWLRP